MIAEKKQHGLTGKQNALKAESERSLSNLHIRCRADERSAWVKAAQNSGVKLSAWVVNILNKKAANL